MPSLKQLVLSWFRPSNPSLSELLLKDTEPAAQEPPATPIQRGPASGGNSPPAGDPAATSTSSKGALDLFLKVAVTVLGALLLFWTFAKLVPSLQLRERASPQPAISTPGVASPRQSAPQGVAPAPRVPSAPVPTATVPPQPGKRSLCSPADETAGLCKP